jgi:hypothetical protein
MPYAKLAFFSFLALTVCSFVGAVVAAMLGHWSEYLLVPFGAFFVLTAISLRVASTRGEIDASEWRGDI